MKRKIITLALIIFILATAPSIFPLAQAKPSHLNFGAQLNAAECNTQGAKKIVEVTQKVINDDDSGVAGNAWAKDNFNRHIQVWQLTDSTFCAIVEYEGQFTTIAGTSPGGTGTVSDGIQGSFEGGYRSTIFTGTLLSTPTQSSHGFIGTFDYQCDNSFNCLGFVDWTTFYFSTTSGFDLTWWGWTYHAGNNGSWVNAISGNIGDITG